MLKCDESHWVKIQGLFSYVHNIQCLSCLKPLFFSECELIVNILVIVIGLVLIFKNEITSIINSAFDSIKSDSGAILR